MDHDKFAAAIARTLDAGEIWREARTAMINDMTNPLDNTEHLVYIAAREAVLRALRHIMAHERAVRPCPDCCGHGVYDKNGMSTYCRRCEASGWIIDPEHLLDMGHG